MKGIVTDLPNNIEAEKNLIGCIVLDSDTIPVAYEILTPDDFFSKNHKEIFDAVTSLWIEDNPVDIVTVFEKLSTMGVAEDVGGMEYLLSATNGVPTTGNIKHYANIVFEKSQLRHISRTSQELFDMSSKNELESKEILQYAENRFIELGVKQQNNVEDIAEITENVIEDIRQRVANKDKKQGLQTGFGALDDKLLGIRKKDLIVVAARPAMGKSSLAIQIADKVALHYQLPTIMFSVEMSKEKVVERILSGRSAINSKKLRTGNMTDEEFNKMVNVKNTVKRAKLVIDDTPGIAFNEMISKARKEKLKHGELGLVIIDHLTEMYVPGKNERLEISANARNIRNMAKMLGCPVILLVQLSRAVEARRIKRPQLSDLRETGVIEEVADVVMFIYREHYYDKTKNPEKAEIIIAKNRDGETGDVVLKWTGEYTKFDNATSSTFTTHDSDTKEDSKDTSNTRLPYKDDDKELFNFNTADLPF
jgi:replicative DNA helicase